MIGSINYNSTNKTERKWSLSEARKSNNFDRNPKKSKLSKKKLAAVDQGVLVWI